MRCRRDGAMTTDTRAARGDSVSTVLRRFTWAEAALLAVVGLGLLHHVDHVLRVDHSGWPFKDDLTPFTFSLLVYPVAVIVLLLRTRPWLRVGLVAVVSWLCRPPTSWWSNRVISTACGQPGLALRKSRWATRTCSRCNPQCSGCRCWHLDPPVDRPHLQPSSS